MLRDYRHFIGLSVLLVALIFYIYAPAFSADFSGDDFQFLAQAKHVAHPGLFFTQNHSLNYFYRPFVLSIWWLCVHLIGTEPIYHYLIQCALHSVNVLLLFVFCLQLQSKTAPWRTALAFMASCIFGLHQIGIGGSLWLANRFDLVASGALFALLNVILFVLLRSQKNVDYRWAVGLFTCSFISAFSKELSIAVLPAAVAMLWMTGSRNARVTLIIAVSAPFLMMLLARFFLIDEVKSTEGSIRSLAIFATGAGYWFDNLHRALGMGREFARVFYFVLVLATLWAFWMLIQSEKKLAVTLVGLVSILCCAVVIQSPVTAHVLSSPAALSFPVNFRFYYLTLGIGLSLSVMVVSTMTQFNPRTKMIVATMALIVIAIQLPISNNLARVWAETYGTIHKKMRVEAAKTVQAYANTITGRACVVQLLGTTQEVGGDFSGYIDVMVKSELEHSERAFDCFILTERAPWLNVTSASAVLPIALDRPRQMNGAEAQPLLFGGALYRFLPIDLPVDLPPEVYVLRWNGKTFEHNHPASIYNVGYATNPPHFNCCQRNQFAC